MGLSWINYPFLARLLAATALAAWGFRAALSPSGRGWTAVIAACALLLVQASLYWRFTVDDAFIAFQFARNWANGLGPIYQPGDHVEGYTCFLWISLLSLARHLGIQIELAAKVLGISSAIATLPAVHQLVRSMGLGERAAKLAPLLLALSPLYAAWAVAGMDAPLFAAILSWAALAFAAEDRAHHARPVSALLFGLLILARPEGILFAAIAWTALLVAPSRGASRLQRPMAWAAVCGVLAVPYWIWRWSYYGDFLPNTFYAKTALNAPRIYRGLASIGDFAADAGVLVVLLVLLALAVTRARTTPLRFLFGAVASFLAYVVLAGGDVLRLRFYVHILPLWVACVATGLNSLWEALLPRREFRAGRGAIALGVVWAGLAFHENARALSPHDQCGPAYVVDNSNNIHRAHMPLGDWLRVQAPPGSRLAANDIGGLGYQSELPIIDLFGLTDRLLARLYHRGAGYALLAAEVRRRNPELIALYGSSKGAWLGLLSAERPWFERSYRVHSFWPDSPHDRGLVLLVRNDVRLPAASPPGIDFAARPGAGTRMLDP
ncbi:MAG: hypothetical protein HYR73_03955 [Candidatus Eisenbacteria bacterium]|nr:hypothetical protein [Candidatus Eisenbacteria bacterium]